MQTLKAILFDLDPKVFLNNVLHYNNHIDTSIYLNHYKSAN